MFCIRQEIEERERMILGPFATQASRSLGRAVQEEPDPIRSCFMIDRDRIIHSKSFRRLKHKTQVFIAPPGDHYRTRLTHTLEVNQIARTIGSGLNLNLDLIEAIALAHDVGHTPFAHAGEMILDQLLDKGFKHNENSIRVLTRLEMHKDRQGLNLCREVLDGVLNHSGYPDDKKVAATLEGQVIRLSDKIAYVQHDIDDSIRAGLLKLEEVPAEYLEILGSSHSERIATLVIDAIRQTRGLMEKEGQVIVSLSPSVNAALIGLRQFMFENIYTGPICQGERSRAMFVIENLYRYFLKHPGKMSALYLDVAEEEGLEQAVIDYIAGMSDEYCINRFNEIFIPKSLVLEAGRLAWPHD